MLNELATFRKETATKPTNIVNISKCGQAIGVLVKPEGKQPPSYHIILPGQFAWVPKGAKFEVLSSDPNPNFNLI